MDSNVLDGSTSQASLSQAEFKSKPLLHRRARALLLLYALLSSFGHGVADSASKSGDKEPEWRFWTSLWRLKYSEAGRKKPGFRFISMNF